jgi:hypothetical protein
MIETNLAEPLLDKHGIAPFLCVKPDTVSVMRQRGLIPAIKFSAKRYRYRLSDVLKAVGKHTGEVEK